MTNRFPTREELVKILDRLLYSGHKRLAFGLEQELAQWGETNPMSPAPVKVSPQNGIATSAAPEYLDPRVFPPPRGVKLNVLTSGGVQVEATWRPDLNFVAWAPLIKVPPWAKEKCYQASVGKLPLRRHFTSSPKVTPNEEPTAPGSLFVSFASSSGNGLFVSGNEGQSGGGETSSSEGQCSD